jgi:hypothetical protein
MRGQAWCQATYCEKPGLFHKAGTHQAVNLWINIRICKAIATEAKLCNIFGKTEVFLLSSV